MGRKEKEANIFIISFTLFMCGCCVYWKQDWQKNSNDGNEGKSMTNVLTERELLELKMSGYISYKRRVDESVYPSTTLKNIEAHRERIFIKYQKTANKSLHRNIGLAYTEGIIAPLDFSGVFIDADDVFAAVYSLDYESGFQKRKSEVPVLWILITNDEYVPVLPMIDVKRTKLWDRILGRKSNDFSNTIQRMCKNLRYPVCSIEEFEEIMESEHSIRGRVSKRFILEQLYDAKNQLGLFDPYTISCEYGELTSEILLSNGYEI